MTEQDASHFTEIRQRAQAATDRLALYADQLHRDWGCEHAPDFNHWCRECKDHAIADISYLLDQLASVSEGLANCKKENEMLRASAPSDGAERQDPRGNHNEEAPNND